MPKGEDKLKTKKTDNATFNVDIFSATVRAALKCKEVNNERMQKNMNSVKQIPNYYD